MKGFMRVWHALSSFYPLLADISSNREMEQK